MHNFRDWFYMNANELLEGWLRAKEDGNEEDFKNWVFGEYEFYRKDPDKYEVPYHGLFDAESKVEKLIKTIQLGVLQS